MLFLTLDSFDHCLLQTSRLNTWHWMIPRGEVRLTREVIILCTFNCSSDAPCGWAFTFRLKPVKFIQDFIRYQQFRPQREPQPSSIFIMLPNCFVFVEAPHPVL